MRVTLNGELIGQPNPGVDMTFNFPRLIEHVARSRSLCAGTIVGSGTVSNVDRSSGSCCLTEVRMLGIIADGLPSTEFVKYGDCVRIEMLDSKGQPVFGEIKQQVQPYRN